MSAMDVVKRVACFFIVLFLFLLFWWQHANPLLLGLFVVLPISFFLVRRIFWKIRLTVGDFVKVYLSMIVVFAILLLIGISSLKCS
jgi:hypothetical protein